MDFVASFHQHSFQQKAFSWDYVKTPWSKLAINLIYFKTIKYAINSLRCL